MFSLQEKQLIAAAVEKVLLDLKHPEMPEEKPAFTLIVPGKEAWSYAIIKPNWTFDEKNKPEINPWNEVARDVMEKGKE
jgi:hypothetical protein